MASDSLIVRPFGAKAHNFIMREPKDDKRYTVLVGSVRSSKTFALDAKTIVQLSRYQLPSNAKRLMLGTSQKTLYRNVLLDLFSIVGKSNYSYNQSSGELWLFGKQWFCMGAKDEAAYRQILGMTVGLSVADEVVEYPKSFLAQLFLRMSPSGARFYGSTNPSNPYCYLKSEVIDNPEFAPDLEVINFSLDDNPNMDARSKAAIVASQTGVYRQRYILGLWVLAAGSIYKDAWDAELNTCTNKTQPIGLTGTGGFVDHYFAVDCGVGHPQATYEFYDDGTKIWVTREDVWNSKITMQQRTDGQYADALEKFMGGRNQQVIVPPEAASYKAELASRGFWVTDADNAVSEGIHTVSSLLYSRRLIINKDECPLLVRRIPEYVWDEAALRLGNEEPKKINDDEVDALRYGVHGKIPVWRVANNA
jgi:PBSX family phage terminase large subunit